MVSCLAQFTFGLHRYCVIVIVYLRGRKGGAYNKKRNNRLIKIHRNMKEKYNYL